MALRRSCHPTQLAPPPATRAAAQLSALPVAQQCTQMAQNSSERPFSAICVHYCVPLRHHGAPARPPAAQQCTQMPQNGSVRPFSAICVHYCVTTGRPRDPRAATVYTNGPEQLREAVFGDLCTLLCPHPAARATPASQQCTQMPRNGVERPFSAICVHYCVPLRHQGAPAQPPRRNSVHKCPETAPRGRFRRSVYAIASPPGRPRNPRVATVYTNAPKRFREDVFGDLCTLLCRHGPPASPPAARVTPASQQCTQSRSP